jgi:hypothetical protein
MSAALTSGATVPLIRHCSPSGGKRGITAVDHPRRVASWIPPDDDHPVVALGKQAIGSAVRSGRMRLGWPQRWLATQAGVSQPMISRLETGRLNGIRWQTLARVVGVLQAGRTFRLPDLLDLSRPSTSSGRDHKD